MQAQIRLLLKEQSDQGLQCLLIIVSNKHLQMRDLIIKISVEKSKRNVVIVNSFTNIYCMYVPGHKKTGHQVLQSGKT